MNKEEKQKKQVYKGVFISNQRKKRQGGRIKCPDMPNKIEVFGFNQALHESEVEWEQVRRYKRENGKAKGSNQQKPKKEDILSNTQAAKKNAPEKNLKFKEKEESKSKNDDKKPKEDMASKNSQETAKSIKKVGDSTNKNRKFKPKVQEQKQQNLEAKDRVQKEIKEEKHTQASKTEEKVETKQETLNQQSETKQLSQSLNSQPKEQSKDEGNRQGQVNQIDDKVSESSEDSGDQSMKNLEIIVGRIKRQTNIIYKTKPFVAIMDFFKKNKKNYKSKRQVDDPIEQILQDFNVDIVPIHTRLPRMEMDELIDQNITILSDYAIKTLQFDKKKKRKDELNRIIDSLSNTYIFVTFSDWDGDYPLAKIHKVLGKALTISGQCERFLYQHGLNDLHYEEDQSCPKQPLQLQPTALHQNIDRMVFTIDPATSTDLDDALSIEAKGDLYQIGIHIADVSSYLHLIDRQEIVRRTTSVYLPYKVYHMLQSHLVKVCSLDPGLFRLAFTVWVTMDLEGNVIGEGRLQKNIVQSRFKLSYEVVQNVITGKMGYEEFNQKYPCNEEQFYSLLDKLLKLAEIAAGHRKKRVLFDVFENRELEFRTDESSWPIECFIDKRFAAKKMVEEFMIIGNIESARFLVRHQPLNSLVIHHPRPTKLAVNSFNEQFKILQAKFRFQNVLSVQKQLQELQLNQKVKEQIKQLCYFRARRIMEPAIYRKYHEIIQENQEKLKEKSKEQPEQQPKAIQKTDKEEYPIVHFALGLQFYTHFTSPMRRMADILVHEVLTQVLEGKPPLSIETSEIQKINAGRRSTKRLKKDLNEVYLCLMIHRTKHSLETEGIISSFGMESVSIYIPLFDMQKEVLWKKQFRIHSIHRIRDKDDRLDVKLKHDRVSAKGDVYWVMKKFEKVKLILGCTKSAPLKLTVQMQVQSEKGPFKIEWVE